MKPAVGFEAVGGTRACSTVEPPAGTVRTGKPYAVLYEAPEEEWEKAWKIGEPIRKQLIILLGHSGGSWQGRRGEGTGSANPSSCDLGRCPYGPLIC